MKSICPSSCQAGVFYLCDTMSNLLSYRRSLTSFYKVHVLSMALAMRSQHQHPTYHWWAPCIFSYCKDDWKYLTMEGKHRHSLFAPHFYVTKQL